MSLPKMNQTDDLKMYKGVTLGGCHTVEDILGEGTFGVVVKCRNTETNTMVAIKVFKNYQNSVNDAKEEISILKKLWRLDPDKCNIVRWDGFFFHKENICLNFELLDQNLREFMQRQCAMPIQELGTVVHQLATALSHMSSMGLVHGDIKPENIMVVDRREQPLRVKLADFGLAKNVSEIVPGDCVQTLWYRAPEVILGVPFNETVDVWSLGLVAVELATGQPLYPGRSEYDILNFVTNTQGQPADDVLDRGKEVGVYFLHEYTGVQRWKLKSPEQFSKETGCQPKDARPLMLSSLDDLQLVMEDVMGPQRTEHLFVLLVKKMLDLDPDLRVNSQTVLLHPFFNSLTSRSENCIDGDTKTISEAPFQVDSVVPVTSLIQDHPCSSVSENLNENPLELNTHPSSSTCLGGLSGRVVAALRKVTGIFTRKFKFYTNSPGS
uniref:homeodomain-interacting protein kinase 3-like n=1 Tax=Doryrhamphus excisus TaxID=161450 RepID=UPI0025ADEC42|nr:homeodomain-interacting protein kinase 3-like [Doryrhamphus excisus]